jgi:Protein of unknown function (DUF3141)
MAPRSELPRGALFGPFCGANSGMQPFGALQEYLTDAWQRSILFLDVLRQRGDNAREYMAREAPNVLSFEFEPVLDGRTLERPVNYGLVRIVPPKGVEIDPKKRPFIVFDPRAGHGPGIGGMKQDSEIGVALRAGHPCYFVGFLPEPMPGQTVADVCRAEARFVEEVTALHPRAEGKPCLIGNCQAGWQIMITSAIRPDLPGPIVLAGSPLSYWAGVRGKNPMRYLGGLLGGTWLTSLAGDLGNGIFDGANLIANFESLHPSNTYWKKAYDVYAKVDTEPPRYLEFEKYWGSPVLLTAQEMQGIADQLFVGNKLSSGQLLTADGIRVDLRNIRSPIVVFCSWGDDITPPQQALDWILDLYETDKELVEAGQTIVYCLHQSIGHLGIFVSGNVATKEHGEFAQCMDMIDLLPPGLYEAVITGVDEHTVHRDLIQGRYLFTIEQRTLNDIRALGGNDAADDLRFATAARVSEINRGLYDLLLRPAVRPMVTEQSARFMRAMHPHRVQYEAFSERNPLTRPIAALATQVRGNRQPVSADNPFLGIEHTISNAIVSTLDAWTQARDTMVESIFLTTYGSPLLQAVVGLSAGQLAQRRRMERDLTREAMASHVAAELRQRIDQGEAAEAFLRAIIYVRGPERRIDERGFRAVQELNAAQPESRRVALSRTKDMVKYQFLIMMLDEERAIAALPKLLPPEPRERGALKAAIRRVLSATGELSEEDKRRLARVEALFASAGETRKAAEKRPSLVQG